MLEIFIVCAVAFFASGLTLFSGFGLGTILLPAFVLFFPVDVAIALTAIVHFLNNLLKLFLWWKNADREAIVRFGATALVAAFLGAKFLFILEGVKPLATYLLFDKEFFITPLKLTIALLMMIFVVLEALPAFQKISFSKKFLPLGGILSGFLGGLSGHQGAFRSAFLMKCNLTKESFIATGIVIACLVDLSRLSVYSVALAGTNIADHSLVLALAVLSAFAGVFIASRLVQKVTLQAVQRIVSIMIFLIALLLGAGVI